MTQPAILKRRTLVDEAHDALHEQIVSGKLAPGSAIRFRSTAATLQMSPIPIREALRRLEQSGLVELTPHHGARVTPISLRDLADTYDIRRALEGVAIRRAAERMTSSQAAAVEQRLSEFAQALGSDGAPERIARAHADFHLSLYEMANSPWLQRLIEPLWQNSERYRRLAIYDLATHASLLLDHARLLERCRAGDTEAAALEIDAHLSRTSELIRVRLAKQSASTAIDHSGPRRSRSVAGEHR